MKTDDAPNKPKRRASTDPRPHHRGARHLGLHRHRTGGLGPAHGAQHGPVRRARRPLGRRSGDPAGAGRQGHPTDHVSDRRRGLRDRSLPGTRGRPRGSVDERDPGIRPRPRLAGVRERRIHEALDRDEPVRPYGDARGARRRIGDGLHRRREGGSEPHADGPGSCWSRWQPWCPTSSAATSRFPISTSPWLPARRCRAWSPRSGSIFPTDFGTVVVYDADELAALQKAVRTFERLVIVLVLLVLVLVASRCGCLPAGVGPCCS